MNAAAGIALTIALLALNGFFVAAEFALVAARRSAIEAHAGGGSRRATRTLRSMQQLSLMLAGAQLGVTICSLGLGAVSEPVIAHLLEPAFHGMGIPSSAAQPVAFVLALTVVTALHVVLGEMVPKNATLAAPEDSALWLAPALAALVRIMRPLIWLLNAVTNLGLRALGVRPRAEVASTVTREELAGVVGQSRREGLLEADDHELVSNAIGFESATVADLMVPLAAVHLLAPQPSADDVERLAARTGVTRFPVRDSAADPAALVGYVHLRDVLGVAATARHQPLPPERIRVLPTVAAGQPLTEAVELMRSRRTHIARVVSSERPGHTVGVVTLDDILASLTRA